MRTLPFAIVTVTVVTLSGCSGNEETDGGGGTVTGAWCGEDVGAASACVGDEYFYMELSESDAGLSGFSCEHYGRVATNECDAFASVSFDGGQLELVSSTGWTGSFEYSGRTLEGQIQFEGMSLAYTLYRVE